MSMVNVVPINPNDRSLNGFQSHIPSKRASESERGRVHGSGNTDGEWTVGLGINDEYPVEESVLGLGVDDSTGIVFGEYKCLFLSHASGEKLRWRTKFL